MKVYTEAVQFKADSKLIDLIQKKLDKLDRFYDRIIEARVTLKLENTGKIKDKITEIQLKVPGETLFAKETDKKFEVAVDHVTKALRKQLMKYKETLQLTH